MYIAILALTMFVLPVASIAIEHGLDPGRSLLILAGRWFVFWGVGARLGLAGARQVLQPAYTARQIFRLSGDEALPLVRELGLANLCAALIALLSVAAPSFVVPAALSAGVFYGVAGVMHAARRRSANETIAMVSDFFMFAVLAAWLVARLAWPA